MMTEKEILDKILESAEDIEVPQSLSPENIRSKLERQQAGRTQGGDTHPLRGPAGKKRSWRRSAVRFLEAAAVVAIVIVGGQMSAPMKNTEDTEHAVSEHAVSEAVPAEDAADNAAVEMAAEDQPEALTDTAPAADVIRSYTEIRTVEDGFETAESPKELYDRLKTFWDEELIYRINVDYSSEAGAVFDESADIMPLGIAAKGEESDTYSAVDYSETNLREAGVDEGDVVKTDGRYLYILKRNSCVKIVDVQGKKMKEAAIVEPEDASERLEEIYLDQDRLYLITSGFDSRLEEEEGDVYMPLVSPYSVVYTYDISDREVPECVGRVRQEGYYNSSRKNGSYIYLLTGFYPEFHDIYRDRDVMPLVNGEMMEISDICIPEYLEDVGYLVISSVCADQPDEVMDSKAIVSALSNFYMSGNNIYIWTGGRNMWFGGHTARIMKVNYQDGMITPGACCEVRGYINDSFSIDEYDGVLRVLTTDLSGQEEANNLFLLDGDLKLLGKITDIAEGETVRSARMMGPIGYFVTFRQTDPLFSVDLSDPADPKILGELKIPGFSSYLHPYGEGRLLGVGFDADEDTGITSGVKLSMFDVEDPSDVKEMKKFVIDGAYHLPAAYNYKAITVNEDKNLIGFVCDRNYYVFSFDEAKGFENLLMYPLGDEYWYGGDDFRGVYTGSDFFIVTDSGVLRFDMEEKFCLTEKLEFVS